MLLIPRSLALIGICTSYGVLIHVLHNRPHEGVKPLIADLLIIMPLNILLDRAFRKSAK